MPIGLLQLHLYVKMLDKVEFLGFFNSDFFTTFLSIDPRWSPEELQQKWGHHMSVRVRREGKGKILILLVTRKGYVTYFKKQAR